MKVKILRIVLETVNIKKMKEFYTETLEMTIVRATESLFTVRAGNTHITFQRSSDEEAPLYHFALRTNVDFYDHMISKMKNTNVTFLLNKEGELSEFWKGKRVYFTDPDGNIVEILERKFSNEKDISDWYDVCEIGIPSEDVAAMSEQLSPINNDHENNSESDTFRFYGDVGGQFVLVKEGRNWYPTNRPATIHPIVVEVEGNKYHVLKFPELPYTIKVKNPWSSELPVVQMRIARPTDQLDKVIDFYEVGMGLQRIGEFHNHDGYTGVMFGLPDSNFHFEFTSHEAGSPCQAPTKDNLNVFYLPDWDAVANIASRLNLMGYPEVEAENPYWRNAGITIEDPDGWRIVLFCSTGL